MLSISCRGCGTTAYADCGCPPGHDPAQVGAHHDQCAMGNLDALVVCPPSSDCCKEDHDHGAAANACPGNHGACPDPDGCHLWENVKSHRDPDLPSDLPDACPGGHCHKDADGCTVCRPLIITVLPGTGATVRMAG